VDSVAYGYDAAGQRVTKTEGQAAPSDTAFAATYDEANRLVAITLNGEAFTLSYDDNGNLASKSGPVSGTTSYSWSARNQLVGIAGPNGSASFKYDALGRRIEKTLNGVTTGYLYDGVQAIAELKGGAVDAVLHTGFVLDEVIARYGSSGNRVFLQDALMSVIAQTNDAGNAESFRAYSPYGESIALGPDGGNDLQYAGLRNDGTGLLAATYRYYDPVLKQWISEDPIGLLGGLNLYAYVGGKPVMFSDPRGLDAPGGVIGTSMGIGAISVGVAGGIVATVAASGEAAGAIGGLLVAGAAAKGAMAGLVIGGAVGAAIAIPIAIGIYYYNDVPGNGPKSDRPPQLPTPPKMPPPTSPSGVPCWL
jgi:RHS repeat-associated protein